MRLTTSPRLLRVAAVWAALLLLASAAGCGAQNNTSNHAPPSPRSTTEPVSLQDLMSAPVPSLCKHGAGNLTKGMLPPQEGSLGFVAIAHKSATDESPQVAFGDLTGDGVADAALVTACTAGGVAWPATVQLYTAGPTRLGGVDLGEITHGGREFVTDVSISEGTTQVSWITQGPNEPACCGTVKMAGDLRVERSEVVIENVRKLN
jgi:hypothetical protein